jgi:ketosteroid isomerase-like protein
VGSSGVGGAFVPSALEEFFKGFAALPKDEATIDAFRILAEEAGMVVVGTPLAQSHPLSDNRGDAVAAPDLEDFIDAYHRALDAFLRGDPQPAKGLYSRREDAGLANPFGPVAIGWDSVAETMDRAAANHRDGRATGFETLRALGGAELACLVEVERFEAEVGGSEEIAAGALRVTSVLRPEDGSWRVVHRHADPITSARASSSVIQP